MTQPDDVVLPTYTVLARFRQQAQDADDAVRAVVAALSAQHEPFHEVEVEREEGPGTWMVVARFVISSVDPQLAVQGVGETLRGADLLPDEVWSTGRIT
ncbi:MAG: hypothetical protein ACXVGH_09290 [Mycobacteriales bacterium]